MTVSEAVAKYSAIAPWLADDIAGMAALASWEATHYGFSEAWAVERVRWFAEREFKTVRTELSCPTIESGLLPRTQRDRKLTPGQKRRLGRDIMIRRAVANGISQRQAAWAFGLAPSRINAIVRQGRFSHHSVAETQRSS